MECKEKITYCENCDGFEQMSIFGMTQEPQCHGTPRHSLAYYGLTDERVEELEKLIQSGTYASLASKAAHTANKTLSEYIMLSITKNLSYEGLEKLWGRGEIERMPYGRTDFYGIRRYAIHLFDLEMRRIGK